MSKLNKILLVCTIVSFCLTIAAMAQNAPAAGEPAGAGAAGRGGAGGGMGMGGGMSAGGRGAAVVSTQRPDRAARLASIAGIEKQIAVLRSTIQKAPATDPCIPQIQADALTTFRNQYTAESNSVNAIAAALNSLRSVGGAAGGGRGGAGSMGGTSSSLTSDIIKELLVLAKVDKAVKLTTRLQILADSTPETILLWADGAPGAMGNSQADKPTITFYRAKGANKTGTSVIIAPGGAYQGVATATEGEPTASRLNAMGINVFMLRYRVSPYRHPVELGDAQRAIRMVRSRADEFGINPNRIGMMGFSAGGHLISTAGTHYDAGNPNSTDPIERASSRPDFMALIYPVISFQTNISGQSPLAANAGTGRNLLGNNPDPNLIDELSNELKVTAQTPPTFLVHGTADTLVSVQHSVQFYLALLKAGVPAELHTFEKGGHGFGAGGNDPAIQIWPTLLENWLRGRGLLENSSVSSGNSIRN